MPIVQYWCEHPDCGQGHGTTRGRGLLSHTRGSGPGTGFAPPASQPWAAGMMESVLCNCCFLSGSCELALSRAGAERWCRSAPETRLPRAGAVHTAKSGTSGCTGRGQLCAPSCEEHEP